MPLHVSDRGDVRTVDRETPYQHTRLGRTRPMMMKFKGRVLKQATTNGGYKEVATCHQGRKVAKFYVHRLVALAFVPGYSEGMWVNHLNGDKTDNRPENLEWVTPGQNSKHAWESGLVDLRGENQPTSKLKEDQVAEIKKLLAQGIPPRSLAIIAGVSLRAIGKIRDRENWRQVNAT